MIVAFVHPSKGGIQVITNRRQVDCERRGKSEGGEQGAAAQQLGQRIRSIGHDSGTIKQVLQTGNLGKNRSHRRHLHVMTEKAAQRKLTSRTAQVDGVIISSGSIKSGGSLVLKAGPKVARRKINSHWNTESFNQGACGQS